MKIMIFTDNKFVYENFLSIVKNKKLSLTHEFIYACTPNNIIFKNVDINEIHISQNVDELIEKYQLIISCHSKQIFPSSLVSYVRCINIHPGLNPYNRGWFPQVFSIINNKPLGVTIHEMDEKIDHGDIISQKEVPIFSWDTSLSAYERVLAAEILLIEETIEDIINKSYHAQAMKEEGNYNSKQDYDKLCNLDLNVIMSIKESIDLFRSLTHGELKNAYFIDEFGNKVFLRLLLEKEEDTK